jgi:hypothetical protein
MQTVAFTHIGGPEGWRVLEVSDPTPGPARIASGAVDPYSTGVYPREPAPEAYRLLEGRLSQGKLALVHPQ